MAKRTRADTTKPAFEPVGELRVPSRDSGDASAPAAPPASAPPASGPPASGPPEGKPATRVNLDLDALRIRPDQAPSERSARGGGVLKTLVLFFLLGVGGLYAWREIVPSLLGSPPASVRVETVRLAGARERAMAGAFSAAGWVKLPRYHPIYVTPLIEGRVDALLVIEGDKVEKDQVIARLYAKDYCATCEAAEAAVLAAEATYEKMKAGFRKQEVAEAEAVVVRLRAELATARKILAHSEELHPKGAISEEELLRDQMRVKTLEADHEKGAQRVSLLEEGYRPEDVALAAAALQKVKAERNLARQRLDYVEIKSPIDGVVLERLASTGQWLQPKDGAIVSLYDPEDLEASVDIGQDDLGRVFVGQSVEIVTRAEPDKTYLGKVVLVEPKADQVKNTVPVRVKLDAKPGDLLFPDMVVKARFLPAEDAAAASAEDAPEPFLTIPRDAVVQSDGATWVLVVEGAVARKRTVVLGGESKGRFRVLDGLKEGDMVVVTHPAGIADGSEVEVQH